jgi:gliding motility-associated-like protein
MVVGNNSFLEISAAGNYSVIATSIEGCESFSKTIKAIPSVIATISQNDITVIDDSENNSITINTSNLGIGDYEFSFNDPYRDYQNEPYFQNITPGIHTIYVRDKNSCGIAPMEISVIGYPKFFTPNNDGHNDTWNVLGVSENFFQSATVYIFNRFGKLITEIDLYSNGWNGTFNGNHLPATDYWFSVELVDIKGNTRVKKGHFSLIRR